MLSFLLTLFNIATVNGKLLLPYGTKAGDESYTDGDDGTISITTPSIKIGSKVYEKFYVSIFVPFLFFCSRNVSNKLNTTEFSTKFEIISHNCNQWSVRSEP